MRTTRNAIIWGILPAVILIGATMPSCRAHRPKPTVQVNGATIQVEVADTKEKREIGLGGRGSLPEGQGMLFVFDKAMPLNFHMRDCYFPIDIAFLDADKKIINMWSMAVEEDPAHPIRHYLSDRDAKYALETVAGAWQRIGAAPGMTVQFANVPERAPAPTSRP